MSDNDKSELLRAANKLKNAKKRKMSDTDETMKNSNKRVKNDEEDNEGLIGNIINAVKRFKGED